MNADIETAIANAAPGVISVFSQLIPLAIKLFSFPAEQREKIIADLIATTDQLIAVEDKAIADMDRTKAEALKTIDEIDTKPIP